MVGYVDLFSLVAVHVLEPGSIGEYIAVFTAFYHALQEEPNLFSNNEGKSV
jgi:hypothetical protein